MQGENSEFFTRTGTLMVLTGKEQEPQGEGARLGAEREVPGRRVTPVGVAKAETEINYLVGPRSWHANV